MSVRRGAHRALLAVGVSVGMASAWTGLPSPAEGKTVNCDGGGKIQTKLGQQPSFQRGQPQGTVTTIVVRGTCTENVVITQDDVIITTDGVNPATIVAADPSLPAVQLDGAHRIVIEGVGAAGITIGGGTTGIFALRGTTLDLADCTITGNSVNGVVSSFGSTVSIDSCKIGPNTGNGAVAANTSSVVITNSTVSGNTGIGILAVRSSYARVGQDLLGTPTLLPVTVSGNGGTGISISESSSGTVVGGVIESSGGTQLFIGRASSGQIGLGSNGLTAGVTIQNGSSNGISIEGGNATVVFSTITGNAQRGIVINNGGSGRIGVTNSNGVFGGNTISGNHTDGIGIFHASSAYVGGNTIDSNTNHGINFSDSGGSIVGGNAITNNGQAGILVRAGQLLVGDTGFAPPTTVNTISGNGPTGSGLGQGGGIYAFDGGNVLVVNATISNNTGAGVLAFNGSVITLDGSTAVTVPAGGATVGGTVAVGSTLRLAASASIVSATSHGIQAGDLSSVRIDNGNTVQGNGAGAYGVNCFAFSPMTTSAATLTGGNLTHVTGTAGGSVGCNVFQ